MILYIDAFSGISGDMVLGAFVDLGVNPNWIESELSPLLDGFHIRTETVFRQHLRATSLFVDTKEDHSSRNYSDIKTLIIKSGYSDWVRKKSLQAFEIIARAESLIHGRDMDHVHFHEIGGIDSMVDIIGSFLCAEKLGVEKVVASQIPLGSGFVDCAHGKIPVPVPAVAAILKGVPVTGCDAKTEIVTPTGAALAKTLASEFGILPPMEIRKIGYGAGKRDTGSFRPNLLRLILGTSQAPVRTFADQVYVIHTNVDDQSPEILGFVMDLLFDHGALDVSFSPVQMKKNRPGTRIEAIVKPSDLEKISCLILSQTSAIGLRYSPCDRKILKREQAIIDTDMGAVEVKKIFSPDGSVTLKPEYESVKKIALEKGRPLKDVYASVLARVNPLDTNGPKR